MLTIYTIIALGVIFNNYIYVVKPPHSTRAIITFDYPTSHNLTRWVEMENDQLDGIDVSKLLLVENNSSLKTVTFKIKFYSNSFVRETTWQSLTEKPYRAVKHHKDDTCTYTLIVCLIILIAIFVAYLLYFYKQYI